MERKACASAVEASYVRDLIAGSAAIRLISYHVRRIA